MITIDDIDVFLLSYNREQYILEMIESLKNQTVGSFEIKILDFQLKQQKSVSLVEIRHENTLPIK